MYKEREKGNEFENFYVPFGGNLRSDNRWVRLAAIIPWDEIEAEYKKRFSNRIGRTAKPVRLASFCASIDVASRGGGNYAIQYTITECSVTEGFTARESKCECRKC
jgi:hypothetical protein